MVEYIPIITTLFAIFFLTRIFPHYRQKTSATYLLWWTIGVFTYGVGTLTESINALAGWDLTNFKVWYISGALLGGFPLAQGSVYLLMKKRFADISTIVLVAIITVAAVCVNLSPVALPQDFDGGLTGRVLEWEWVRYFSPFVNIYSFIFLFGGAIYSAYLYRKQGTRDRRFLGNIYIAIGALLPGIGGSFTRFGYVEVLFVTELIGLILIYAGYAVIRGARGKSVHDVQRDSQQS